MQATSAQLVRAFGTCNSIPTLDERLHAAPAARQIQAFARRRAHRHVPRRGHPIAQGGAS